MHKPSGYVSSRSRDRLEHPIVYDLLPQEIVRRRPPVGVVGRLDKWASGLLLLSTDGEFTKTVISPEFSTIAKTYEVELEHPLRGNEKDIFESGTLVLKNDTKPLFPAKFDLVDPHRQLVRMTLYEGRYHQLRRMLASVGNQAQSIKRVSIGNIHLETSGVDGVSALEEGSWRMLSDAEIDWLMDESNVLKSFEMGDFKRMKPESMTLEEEGRQREREFAEQVQAGTQLLSQRMEGILNEMRREEIRVKEFELDQKERKLRGEPSPADARRKEIEEEEEKKRKLNEQVPKINPIFL